MGIVRLILAFQPAPKALCVCAVLIFSFSAFPQTITGSGSISGSGTISAGPPAAWNPAQAGTCIAFFSYLDLPPAVGFYGWTNEIAPNQVFVSQNSSDIVNTTTGIAFPANANDYLLNGSSGISMTNSVNSIWICFTVNGISSPFNAVLGSANTSGYGVYLSNVGNFLADGNSLQYSGALDLGTQYDILISAGSPAQVYINGTFYGAISPSCPASYDLWGIGMDADSDEKADIVLKFLAFYTGAITTDNMTLLHTYATGH